MSAPACHFFWNGSRGSEPRRESDGWGNRRSIAANMKHLKIIWNPAIKQWFCSKCGRTSDQVSEQQARTELDRCECRIPYVEASARTLVTEISSA
jgi:hypothetical protein